MNNIPERRKSVNWAARILLWLFWPVAWLILLPVARAALDAIRGGMVESARQSGNIEATVHTYGIINAVVMTVLMVLLPVGFVLITKATRRITA